MLSGGTQRRALLRYQGEKMKILNISFPRVLKSKNETTFLYIIKKTID